jgi:hypothetical protein
MTDRREYEQGPVSVDGVWYALIDGEWTQVPSPTSKAPVTAPPIPDGYVSVDGAWFRNVDVKLEPTTSPIPASTSPGRAIPDGYVSVDGGLFRVKGAAEPNDTEGAALCARRACGVPRARRGR